MLRLESTKDTKRVSTIAGVGILNVHILFSDRCMGYTRARYAVAWWTNVPNGTKWVSMESNRKNVKVASHI